MPYLLRKIRKSKWYKYPKVSWLNEGDLQADTLADLQTKNNELSVWQVGDDKNNLEEIVVALAASREHIANLDYALIDQNLVSDLGINLKRSPGESKVSGVADLHFDLIELSACQLHELAKQIMDSGEKARTPIKKIESLLKAAAKSGKIDLSTISPKIAARIAPESAS